MTDFKARGLMVGIELVGARRNKQEAFKLARGLYEEYKKGSFSKDEVIFACQQAVDYGDFKNESYESYKAYKAVLEYAKGGNSEAEIEVILGVSANAADPFYEGVDISVRWDCKCGKCNGTVIPRRASVGGVSPFNCPWCNTALTPRIEEARKQTEKSRAKRLAKALAGN